MCLSFVINTIRNNTFSQTHMKSAIYLIIDNYCFDEIDSKLKGMIKRQPKLIEKAHKRQCRYQYTKNTAVDIIRVILDLTAILYQFVRNSRTISFQLLIGREIFSSFTSVLLCIGKHYKSFWAYWRPTTLGSPTSQEILRGW